MKILQLGQLVRIEAFHKMDAVYDKPDLVRLLVGQTGRFVQREEGSLFGSNYPNTYCGEFEYDPDPLGHNEFYPCFVAVYVEPVEEENEK